MNTAYGSLLVVDDNDMNCDMLSRRLTRRGYTVAVATDGQQALQMIDTHSFDLILLDIMMPGMSGLDVLKILRERYSVADLPIIMVTAKDQSEDIVEALKLGANDYVTKPLDFPVVLARTQTQLSLKQAMQQIQHLAEQLELRNRFIRKTFGRYLTDEVVTSLLDSPEGLQLGGERRCVTMLMSDFRGFTSMAERLSPEQVMTIVNRHLGTMVEVISQYQGTIDEFIGDSIFVIFGAPVQRQDDPQRAVACALAMQLAMASVNAQLRADGLPEVHMGVGVHTGEVVVGNIGSNKRAKYGVVGSHVNLTARIESYTVGGQILISAATQRELAPLLRIAARMEVNTKGVDEPLVLYDIRGLEGDYHLALPEHDETFVPLQESLPICYTILEGKYVGETTSVGSLVALSTQGGEVYSETPVDLWSDVQIRLTGHTGEALPGSFYAKIMGYLPGDGTGFRVRFTSVSPEVGTFFQNLLASSYPGESA
jgi:class 3 adenylate cyclase/CheY-like chemotaxis protein